MTRNECADISGVLGAEYRLADAGQMADQVWRTTLSMADVMARSTLKGFDRNAFYREVFGTADIWRAKDACELSVSQRYALVREGGQ
jgi:hypothetical protein